MRVLALFMLLLGPAVVAEAAPSNVSLTTIEPRDFGYFVGDVFRREVDIDVAEPYQLDKASLPVPGRLTYWLELRSVSLSEASSSGKRHYRLTLDYQSFYVPLEPTRVSVPGLTLKVTDGTESADVTVPALPLLMAAMREIQPDKPKEGPTGYMRPDAVPVPINTTRDRAAILGGTGALALGLLLLAHYQAWWPFRGRPLRPFTKAARAIRLRAARGADQEAYRTSLIDLHRAFDTTAGRRVLAEDIPAFLAKHATFEPLRDDISRFFTKSRQVFFGNDTDGAAKALPLETLADLGSKLGKAERRAA